MPSLTAVCNHKINASQWTFNRRKYWKIVYRKNKKTYVKILGAYQKLSRGDVRDYIMRIKENDKNPILSDIPDLPKRLGFMETETFEEILAGPNPEEVFEYDTFFKLDIKTKCYLLLVKHFKKIVKRLREVFHFNTK